MAGGITKYVPLRLNDERTKWVLRMEELEAAITPKTKLMIINTPHNVRNDSLVTLRYFIIQIVALLNYIGVTMINHLI